ncbi:MAG: circadian clock protein KaiC [Syntrophobacteraceae bacterium]
MIGSSMISINKVPTGIPGFDHIALGGLPENRTTLISGTAGSAKTVIAVQFLAAGITLRNETGVFVTFEESPRDIRRNMLGFGWDIEKWEAEGKWAFVDASIDPEQETVIAGSFDLGALMARIEHAVHKVNAPRVSMDSLGAVFGRFKDNDTVRSEMHRLSVALRKMSVTAVITAERVEEYGEVARYGVEEFVADNVIILRNALEEEKRRRTIEILKFRGTPHQKGEFPFTVSSGEGVIIIPLSAIELEQRSSDLRITSGNEMFDRMCGGGFFRDSIILVSGATGTGKTLMVTEFIAGGARRGEKCLLFAFEESREQLFRNAKGWGVDFGKMEADGLLKVVCFYPEVMGLEDHLIRMKQVIQDFKPNRLAVDSLSALERVSTVKSFREFVISLTSFIKHQEVAGLFTSTTPTLLGGTSITEAHISTITDSIILLRYVEIFGEMRRGLTVLKMRGSAHDKDIREFTIDSRGMHIGEPFRMITGILAGNPMHVSESELERLEGLFGEDRPQRGRRV